jgi:hypothetical protein
VDESATPTSPIRTEGGGRFVVPVLLHVLGIAIGLYVGWQVMDELAPDLPTADPGVASSTEPKAVAPGDADSLFKPANLAGALQGLDDQLAPDQGLLRLKITPGALESQPLSKGVTGYFEPSDISPATPQVIIEQVTARRPQVTIDDVGYMELVATAQGPRWYVQLDTSVTDVSPPWTYGAPLSGTPIDVGPGPPTPIG